MQKSIISESVAYYVKSDEKFIKAEYDNERLNALVDNFYHTLVSNIKEENLHLLNYNIVNLTIKARKDNKFTLIHPSLVGTYDTYKNIVKVWDIEDDDTFYHEMMHMASSFYDASNDQYYDGLGQSKGRYAIGYALNEGYTELTTARLFYDKDSDIKYEYEMVISFLIERILGTEKMQKFYFNCDLKSLITELRRHKAGEKAIFLISYLDDIQDYCYYFNLKRKDDIILKINFINKYLLSTYSEKLKIEIEENKISRSTANKYYLEFYHILNDAIKYLPKKLVSSNKDIKGKKLIKNNK